MSKGIEQRLEEIESAIDAFYGKVKEIKNTNSYSLVSEIEMYNDPSRNPNDVYETNVELVANEKAVCESLGFQWRDWLEVKSLLSEWKSLKDTKFHMESFLKVNYPEVLEEFNNFEI
jgi:hypothetical protein